MTTPRRWDGDLAEAPALWNYRRIGLGNRTMSLLLSGSDSSAIGPDRQEATGNEQQ